MLTFSPSALLNAEKFDVNQFSNVDPTFVSRYLLQAAILRFYQQQTNKNKLKVLDVGGSGSIITTFIDVDLTIIDILPNEANLPNYIQGSALVMPFADSSFDAVISCDVLEHISKDDRPLFLKEIARVTGDLAIVAAPYNLKGVRKAEILANEYYKKMTGEDHRWLFEHLLDELPDLQQAMDTVEAAALNVGSFSYTALDNWQLVTRAGFLLAQESKHPEFTKLIKELNFYYMQHVMSHDFSKTGYRSFLIASKKHKINIKPEPDAYSSDRQALFSLLSDAILKLI